VIWFLEGPSSQRDVVQGARAALPPEIIVYASHSQNRPEITAVADIALVEPKDSSTRAKWVLNEAEMRGVKIVLACKGIGDFEALRRQYHQAGIDLVTGLTNVNHLAINSKAYFTQQCQAAGLAVIPGIEIDSAESLQVAYDQIRSNSESLICIKPVTGIYGAGFWIFDENSDPFRCFAFPDSRRVTFTVYRDIYAQSKNIEPQLIMPYFPGDEVSTDIVLINGKAINWVGRRKKGLYQEFEVDGAAVELAIAAAEHFKLDGIVSVQTKDSADGKPHLLEINLRYSGGIAYTALSGINLAGVFSCSRLNLPLPQNHWKPGVRIKPITSAVIP
jgi:hypothetical protein